MKAFCDPINFNVIVECLQKNLSNADEIALSLKVNQIRRMNDPIRFDDGQMSYIDIEA